MSDEPRDDGRDEASAPWERPGRWAHQRMDATTVDDLLARLDTGETTGESRRHRRASADPDEAVPAGELIAALSATEPTDTPGPEPSGAQSDAPVGGTAAAPEPETPAPEPETRAAEPAAAFPAPSSAEPPAEAAEESAVADADRSRVLASAAGAVAAYAALSRDPTSEVNAWSTSDTDVISATALTSAAHDVLAAGALGATRPPDSDDGSHTHPIGPVIEPDVQSDVARDSILASLRRELGGGAASVPKVDAAAAGSRPRTAYGDTHRHRGWWTAGRAAVAAVAALVLLITGTEWTIKHRADQVLADNHISAIVPDDTNISTPTVDNPTDAAATAKATATQSTAVVNQAGNQVYQAENILMMGSDARLNAEDAKLGNSKVGEDPTMQSDVLMIAHLSADRKHVTVLSIPRDLYVKAPTCKAWDYTTNTLSDQDYVSPYTEWKITNAFSVGGPQCTVKAVQELTGLKITRVIVIDFSGFKDMVDALDGITINVCKPIIDEQLGTVIASAGVQKIDGTQALNMVRARKVEGDPTGDIGRIRRQQVVLSTLLRQVNNAGILLNPARLDSLLQAFTRNTSTDNVTLDDLLQLAQSLGNLSPSHVTFYTLPTVADGEGLDATPIAAEVFNALVNDQPLPGEATETTTTKKTSAATTAQTASTSTAATASSTSAGPQTVTIAPDSVQLQVVNVTGRSGVATKTMTSLNELGFAITQDDLLLPENEVQTAVTVEYDPSNEAAALTVAAAVPGAVLVPTAGLGSVVKLMLGSDFDDTVQAVTVGETVTPTISAPDTSDAASSASAVSSVSSVSSVVPTTTSAPSQTLTTQQISGVNAGTAGCA